MVIMYADKNYRPVLQEKPGIEEKIQLFKKPQFRLIWFLFLPSTTPLNEGQEAHKFCFFGNNL